MNLASKNHAIHFQGLIMIIQLEKKKKKKQAIDTARRINLYAQKRGGKTD